MTKAPITETHPEVAVQWCFELNECGPVAVSSGSQKRVWWRCSLSHTWQATVSNRCHSTNPTGCPYCSGNRVLEGFNDLGTTHPDLVAYWDFDKNQQGPETVTAGSSKKAWWKCPLGHPRYAAPSSRVRSANPAACSVCTGRTLLPGFNDLATTHPSLAAEWDFGRNALTPSELVAGSAVKTWWLCPLGHSYRKPCVKRKAGQGCPYCTGRRVLPGFNDLFTSDPHLAEEWDFGRNAGVNPLTKSRGSDTRVWWLCGQAHSWSTNIYERTSRRGATGCPVCANKRVLPGFNDLVTTHPELAARWHPTENGTLLPTAVTAGSDKVVHWLCEAGHTFSSPVQGQSSGRGCAVCSGNQVVVGVNDLASVRPEVLPEWDFDRNSRSPETYTANSNTSVYWKCVQGHSYRRGINKKRGPEPHGCLTCTGRTLHGYQPSLPGVLYFLQHQESGLFKVGITAVGSTRLQHHEIHGHEVVASFEFQDGTVPQRLERQLLKVLRHWFERPDKARYEEVFGYTDGWTETFHATDGNQLQDFLTLTRALVNHFLEAQEEYPDIKLELGEAMSDAWVWVAEPSEDSPKGVLREPAGEQ